MRNFTMLVFCAIMLAACGQANQQKNLNPPTSPIVGTWRLLSGTIIEKTDTTVTDYTQKLSFIKIINATHFAFLKHDRNKGKDSTTATYGSGGGTYSLTADSIYTEHLEYCDAREWENNDFTFTITIHNDTLTQTGIEKLDDIGVNRLNIEKYVRVKK